MKAITVRNIDDELSRALKAESRKKGKSINSLILDSIRTSYMQGAEGRTKQSKHDLDPLAGTWTEKDAKEFAGATKAFEAIDRELWK